MFYFIRYFFIICLVFSIQPHVFAEQKHAISLYGEPKYTKNFKHFDYANPSAPKKGHLKRLALRTYNSFNPFIISGNAAAGISLIYETLMTGSRDEVDKSTLYGLIAENVEFPKDYSWVKFNLRTNASWHDGNPILSDDVVFSFNTLTKKGSPFYKSYYKNVSKVEALDKHTVKFHMSIKNNREMPNILGELYILPKHYFKDKNFSKASLDIPLGSGPYKIAKFEAGRYIIYERVRDYWGKELPVNKGRYNFDLIQYDYYRDLTVAREAFKSGQFDIYNEYQAKGWATGFNFDAVKKGKVIKEEIPISRSPGMQAFVFNTRKSFFKNREVRKAISLVFDFEWLNKNIFYNQYRRTTSFFQNTDLASSGIPIGLELDYLNKYKNILPSDIFDQEFSLPISNGSGNIRGQLKIAKKILGQNGWLIKNNKLINSKTDEPFKFNIIIVQPSLERVILPFTKNLQKLGIFCKIQVLDSSQYIERINNYDFDMIVTTIPQSFNPGNEQRNYWSSNSAKTPGGRNLAGINSPIIDELIEKIVFAQSRKNLVAATKSLDRVLLWNYYFIPQYHSPNNRIAYWNKFNKPETKPKFGIDIQSWWLK
ncbi:MAG: Oligopeptide-binding protein AppA [Alphaproteobacteria bacterium MarineAlpha2_Bin1]|nr:MAG: Oligopeptide-binding protein AppA [Alphaproteobacteria bacterium MarineAlpha2_Bin1]